MLQMLPLLILMVMLVVVLIVVFPLLLPRVNDKDTDEWKCAIAH